MNFVLVAVIVLGAIGLLSAIILFVCSKKFAVKEAPRLGTVAGLLPQANCGGCGYPGCSGFAAACVKAADKGSIDGLLCPVGGQSVMANVASALGMAIAESAPQVAVVRCTGPCENRPRIVKYDGKMTCSIVNSCGAGEPACGYGCLGCGDCVAACQFGAITMNDETGIPEVDEDKCTSCGACVKACPRNIIEIRLKGKKNRRVYVDCVNKDRGPVAMKACAVSCIACGKCVKVCKFDAISIDNNLAYIDDEKCRLCRLCEKECPQKAIVSINFPAHKQKAEGEEKVEEKIIVEQRGEAGQI